MGKYASQLVGQRDFYKCPAADSPVVQFGPGYPWNKQVYAAVGAVIPTECKQLTVGAHECTACPASAPHTYELGSKTVADCRKCPAGQFSTDGQPCRACRPKCDYPYEYETQACTENTDRICSFCDMASCDATYEYVLTEGCSSDQNTGGRACAPCTDKPPNSHFVPGTYPYSCSWACDEGYFSLLEDRSTAQCQPCTQLDATSCPSGYVHSACSDFLHRDASCDVACNAAAEGKPPENSEWVLTKVSEDGTSIVENASPVDMSIPNAGCMWRCVEGYRKEVLAEGQLSICVPMTL